MKTSDSTIIVFLLASLLALGGCSLQQYAKDADKAAYATVASGQATALGSARPFDVDYRPFAATTQAANTIQVGKKVIVVGGKAPAVQILNLPECLEIAYRNSRSLQDHTENLYENALVLANKRRSWDSPLLSGNLKGSTGISKTGKGGDTHAGAAGVDPTLTQRFVHGGVLTLNALISLATDFSGSDTTSIGSLLGARFTQPLLRGAWDNIAYEAQYRLERDFLIAVFGYQRFIQSFEAGIFTSHYEVLRLQDKVRNEKENIKRLGETANLTSIKVEGGRVSRIELDQANQNLFNAQISYEEDMQKYRDALDLFKIEVGLPVLANVELDYPVALEELAKDGLPPVGFAEDQAINTALAVRPDVLAQRAKLRDARRDVELAADAFLPQLDVTVGIAALSGGQRDFYNIRFDRNTRTASATFNYELDQTEHRNVYRRSLIALVKETRDYQKFVDIIRLEVRQSYRQLAQTRRTYELQRLSVDLARRRRSLAALQQKEGLASARDVLESEAALNEAQNGLTEKLVSYTSTRVRFLAALGLIDVDEKGLMHERSKPFNFERIGRRYPYVASDQSN